MGPPHEKVCRCQISHSCDAPSSYFSHSEELQPDSDCILNHQDLRLLLLLFGNRSWPRAYRCSVLSPIRDIPIHPLLLRLAELAFLLAWFRNQQHLSISCSSIFHLSDCGWQIKVMEAVTRAFSKFCRWSTGDALCSAGSIVGRPSGWLTGLSMERLSLNQRLLDNWLVTVRFRFFASHDAWKTIDIFGRRFSTMLTFKVET